jgi:excisionase family DNA binding protein
MMMYDEQHEVIAYGLKSAARAIDVRVPHLRDEIRRGRLSTVRSGERVLIEREELIRYLRSGASK